MARVYNYLIEVNIEGESPSVKKIKLLVEKIEDLLREIEEEAVVDNVGISFYHSGRS